MTNTVGQLNRSLGLPPAPRGGTGNRQLDDYLRELGEALAANHRRVVDRIERVVELELGNHEHDDLYYTETETDTLLLGKSDVGHTHDGRYYTETEVDTLLLGKSDTGHSHVEDDITDLDHDDPDAFHQSVAGEFDNVPFVVPLSTDRFIFEDASDGYSKKYNTLNSLADTHNHDSNYYTESEVNSLLNSYLPLTAGSGDRLTGDLYFGTNNLALVGKATTAVYYDLIKMDSSNRVTIGEGGLNIKLDSTGTIFLGEYGCGVYMENSTSVFQEVLAMSSSEFRVGSTTSGWSTLVQGPTTRVSGSSDLRLQGFHYSGTAAPGTGTWTSSGDWGIHIDTDANGGAGAVYLVYRYGGSVKTVELT